MSILPPSAPVANAKRTSAPAATNAVALLNANNGAAKPDTQAPLDPESGAVVAVTAPPGGGVLVKIDEKRTVDITNARSVLAAFGIKMHPPTEDEANEAEKKGAEKQMKLEPLYVPANIVQKAPTKQQFAVIDLMKRKFAAPYADFVEWFSKIHVNALYNWDPVAPGVRMPKKKTDPIMKNPNIEFSAKWVPTSYGSDRLEFNVMCMNKHAIAVPDPDVKGKMNYEPGMLNLSLVLPPMVVDWARVGPDPGYLMQSMKFTGFPLVASHTVPWKTSARRPYGMHAAFDDTAKFLRIMEEQIAAWVATSGDDCVIPLVRSDLVRKVRTPTEAYFEVLEKIREHAPFVEHESERIKISPDKWDNKPGSASPDMPSLSVRVGMTTGDTIKAEEKAEWLQAIRYDKAVVPDVEYTKEVWRATSKNRWRPVYASRPYMVVTATGATFGNDKMSEEEMLAIGRGAVVSVRASVEFKVNSSKTKKKDALCLLSLQLRSFTYYGDVSDFSGVSRPRRSDAFAADSAGHVDIDNDVIDAMKSARAYDGSVQRTGGAGVVDIADFSDLNEMTENEFDEIIAAAHRRSVEHEEALEKKKTLGLGRSGAATADAAAAAEDHGETKPATESLKVIDAQPVQEDALVDEDEYVLNEEPNDAEVVEQSTEHEPQEPEQDDVATQRQDEKAHTKKRNAANDGEGDGEAQEPVVAQPVHQKKRSRR